MHLSADRTCRLLRLAFMPEAASGWLRFGVMALPKHAPPFSFPR